MLNMITPFTTLKYSKGELQNFNEHLTHLKKIFENIFKKSWTFNAQALFDYINLQATDDKTYRINIYATNPASFKVEPYTPCYKTPIHLKTYKQAFISEYPRYKIKESTDRQIRLKEAQDNGYSDYIYRDSQGYLLETTFANLFWIRDKTLYTPSRKLPIYKGITLQKVLLGAKSIGFKVEEVCEKTETLEDAQVFICNAMIGIAPVLKLNSDDLPISKAMIEKLCKQIQERSHKTKVAPMISYS